MFLEITGINDHGLILNTIKNLDKSYKDVVIKLGSGGTAFKKKKAKC